MHHRIRRLIIDWIVIATIASANPSANANANSWEPVTRANISKEDKIYALINVFNSAIDEPDCSYLEDFTSVLKESDKSTLVQRIQTLNAEISERRRDRQERGRILTLQPKLISSDSKGSNVLLEALLEQNGFVFPRKINLVIKKDRGREYIENAEELLSSLEELVRSTSELFRSNSASEMIDKKTKSLATRNQYSPNLLVPRIFYQNKRFTAPRFTVQKSIEQWRHWIFGRTYDMIALEYQDVIADFCHQYFFVTDPNWNRVIGADYLQNHLGLTGSYGTGSYNFNQPMGITNIYPDGYVVADYYNNRATVYELQYNGSLSYTGQLTNGYNGVVDVASALFESHDVYGENPLGQELAVLDKGNGRVVIYSAGSSTPVSNIKTLFSQGSGAQQLKDPTALCYARSYILGYNSHCIYVADNGNHRIMRAYTRGSAPDTYGSSSYAFLPNAELSSIDVDAYGYVYVLDRYNCIVYLFTPDLSEMIAYYGGRGTADGQLLFPNKIKFADSWSTDASGARPNLVGDLYISEHFGDSTGIRRFALGCDAQANGMSYFPKPCSSCVDYLRFDWWQGGFSTDYIKIYKGNTLFDSIESPRRTPGDNYHYWSIPDSTGNGWYKYVVRLVSPFSTTDITIRDSLFVARYIDICGTCGIRFSNFTVWDTSVCNPDPPFQYDCTFSDPNKWYPVVVQATDQYHRPMTYTYISPYFLLYPDTLGSSGAFSLTMNKDTVYFKFYPLPQGWIDGIEKTIMRVEIDVGCTKASGRAAKECYSQQIDTTGPPCGVCDLRRKMYTSQCTTPCCSIATCCHCGYQGCPILYSFDGKEYNLENNLLPQSEENAGEISNVTDFCPINLAHENNDKEYAFLIREDEQEMSYFDRLELLAYDIPSQSKNIKFDHQNIPVELGEIQIPPIKAISENGEDILPLLLKNDTLIFSASGRGYLEVEYRLDQDSQMQRPIDGGHGWGFTPRIPDKRASKLHPEDSARIDPNIYIIYAKDIGGNYLPVDTLYPRVNDLGMPIDLSRHINDGVLSIRLEWTNDININFLPYIEIQKIEAEPTIMPLVKAIHSTQNEVTSLLAGSSDPPVTLRPGEKIELAFKAEPVKSGFKRLLLLKAVGRYKRLSPEDTAGTTIPQAFDFSQNYPNPFNPTTSFKFALPRDCHVKLEILNILGQKIATILDEWQGAGIHEIVWNGELNSGSPVASGVYFATIKAGKFTSTKKMVAVK